MDAPLSKWIMCSKIQAVAQIERGDNELKRESLGS